LLKYSSLSLSLSLSIAVVCFCFTVPHTHPNTHTCTHIKIHTHAHRPEYTHMHTLSNTPQKRHVLHEMPTCQFLYQLEDMVNVCIYTDILVIRALKALSPTFTTAHTHTHSLTHSLTRSLKFAPIIVEIS